MKNAVKKMKTNNEKGIQAELQAIDYLKSQNYTILRHRFLSPYGEIDILALKNQVLIAVEVKQRQYLEAARTCISYRQRQRIENALLYFVSQCPQYKDFSLRLDVVLTAEKQRVHIENAWI